MKKQLYNPLKARLTNIANYAKVTFKNDKPAQRQLINDEFNSVVIELDTLLFQEKISEKKQIQLLKWLENYACKLHPKK
jgi:hypothetical protein